MYFVNIRGHRHCVILDNFTFCKYTKHEKFVMVSMVLQSSCPSLQESRNDNIPLLVLCTLSPLGCKDILKPFVPCVSENIIIMTLVWALVHLYFYWKMLALNYHLHTLNSPILYYILLQDDYSSTEVQSKSINTNSPRHCCSKSAKWRKEWKNSTAPIQTRKIHRFTRRPFSSFCPFPYWVKQQFCK